MVRIHPPPPPLKNSGFAGVFACFSAQPGQIAFPWLPLFSSQ
jgi:hypothetical protein